MRNGVNGPANGRREIVSCKKKKSICIVQAVLFLWFCNVFEERSGSSPSWITFMVSITDNFDVDAVPLLGDFHTLFRSSMAGFLDSQMKPLIISSSFVCHRCSVPDRQQELCRFMRQPWPSQKACRNLTNQNTLKIISTHYMRLCQC